MRRVKGRRKSVTESENFDWVSLGKGVKIRPGRDGTRSLRMQRPTEGEAANTTWCIKTMLWYPFRSMDPVLWY